MRWRITVGMLAVLLLGVTACSDEPVARTAAGVPEKWYATVDSALAKQPDVGTTAIVQSGRCPLRQKAVLRGKQASDQPDHGVVRLGGDTPAVLCSWYDGTVVDVEVAHAPDAARYGDLVSGSHAVSQPGNRQTEQEVAIGGRTVRVVRILYPTNPSAGTSLVAYLLDEGARGRVRLQVGRVQELPGYDERAVAADLVAFVGG